MSADDVIMFIVGAFVVIVIALAILDTFDMNRVNDITREYWDEYWEEEDENGEEK